MYKEFQSVFWFKVQLPSQLQVMVFDDTNSTGEVLYQAHTQDCISQLFVDCTGGQTTMDWKDRNMSNTAQNLSM